jgi:transcriptional regulator with XRE-family HTH domain
LIKANDSIALYVVVSERQVSFRKKLMVDFHSPIYKAKRYDNVVAPRAKTQEAHNEAARKFAKAFAASRGGVTLSSKEIGVSQPTLTNFLSGKNGAGLKMLTGLAKAAGVSVQDVIGGRVVFTAKGPSPADDAIRRLEGIISPETADYLRKTKREPAWTIAEYIEDAIRFDRAQRARKKKK